MYLEETIYLIKRNEKKKINEFIDKVEHDKILKSKDDEYDNIRELKLNMKNKLKMFNTSVEIKLNDENLKNKFIFEQINNAISQVENKYDKEKNFVKQEKLYNLHDSLRGKNNRIDIVYNKLITNDDLEKTYKNICLTFTPTPLFNYENKSCLYVKHYFETKEYLNRALFLLDIGPDQLPCHVDEIKSFSLIGIHYYNDCYEIHYIVNKKNCVYSQKKEGKQTIIELIQNNKEINDYIIKNNITPKQHIITYQNDKRMKLNILKKTLYDKLSMNKNVDLSSKIFEIERKLILFKTKDYKKIFEEYKLISENEYYIHLQGYEIT